MQTTSDFRSRKRTVTPNTFSKSFDQIRWKPHKHSVCGHLCHSNVCAQSKIVRNLSFEGELVCLLPSRAERHLTPNLSLPHVHPALRHPFLAALRGHNTVVTGVAAETRDPTMFLQGLRHTAQSKAFVNVLLPSDAWLPGERRISPLLSVVHLCQGLRRRTTNNPSQHVSIRTQYDNLSACFGLAHQTTQFIRFALDQIKQRKTVNTSPLESVVVCSKDQAKTSRRNSLR